MQNNTNTTDTSIIIQVELSVLVARLVVSATCLVMMSFLLAWGYLTSIHKAPGFVKVLVILIAISNFAGILFSYSMYDNSIYDSWNTFAW